MKLPRNWRSYQVRIDGDDRLIETLSQDELRFALVKAIDALEDVDTSLSAAVDKTTGRIETWRSGDEKPMRKEKFTL